MRPIDADELTKMLFEYITKGVFESAKDCAEFNHLIKEMPTLNVNETSDEDDSL